MSFDLAKTAQFAEGFLPNGNRKRPLYFKSGHWKRSGSNGRDGSVADGHFRGQHGGQATFDVMNSLSYGG